MYHLGKPLCGRISQYSYIFPLGRLFHWEVFHYLSLYFLLGTFFLAGSLSITLITPEGIVLAEYRGYLIPLHISPCGGTFL